MAVDSIVCARIDTKIENEAAAALGAMGLSVSDAIRLLFVRVAKEKRLPFELTQPNANTRAAMIEARVMSSARSKLAKKSMKAFKKAGKKSTGYIDAGQRQDDPISRKHQNDPISA